MTNLKVFHDSSTYISSCVKEDILDLDKLELIDDSEIVLTSLSRGFAFGGKSQLLSGCVDLGPPSVPFEKRVYFGITLDHTYPTLKPHFHFDIFCMHPYKDMFVKKHVLQANLSITGDLNRRINHKITWNSNSTLKNALTEAVRALKHELRRNLELL